MNGKENGDGRPGRPERRGNAGASGERRQEQAMKLMCALSGVSGELLERSERDGRRDGLLSHGQRFSWKYMRAAAAVLCLIAVGTVSWGGYRLSRPRSGDVSGSAANNEGIMELQYIEIAGDAEDAGYEEAGPEEAARSGENPADPGSAVKTEFGGISEGEIISDMSAVNSAVNKEKIIQAEADGAVADRGCMRLNATEFDEQTARAMEKTGAYVPATLPAGYVFESAYRNEDMQAENLTVTWCRGLDCIMIHIEMPEDVPATVDTEKPETYDERLYQIPYAESVPAEYWQSMDNPVFAAEDLTLETVKSRVLSHSDAGDTDTPRGNFSVLYPDGVLVRFNGRGTPDEIWELFASMPAVKQ